MSFQHWEYFFFHLVVVVGPLSLSFEHRIRFKTKWARALISAGIVSIPYLTWDAYVAGSHWDFNEKYIIGWQVFGLPVEECLFFITVPWACLFIWENICYYVKKKEFSYPSWLGWSLSVLLLLASSYFYYTLTHYTGNVLLVLSLLFPLDRFFGLNLLKLNWSYYMVLLILITTYIFNGYLTSRPVVTYGEEYQMGFRISTIPIEDFLYGLGHLFLVIFFYEKMSLKKNES